MIKRACALLLLAALLTGCGGGRGVTDRLFTLRSGSRWTYSFINASVTLPVALGGGTQNLKPSSTLTMEVAATTTKDPKNPGVPLNILDRKFTLNLLDGRTVTAHQRLYFTQTGEGIFVHGINFSTDDTLDPSKDKFVAGTYNPPFRFVYLPDPATPGASIHYTSPLGAGTDYRLQIENKARQPVSVPAGDFLSVPFSLTERLSNSTKNDFALTSAGLTADIGVTAGVVDANLPDGSALHTGIQLTSVSL